MNIRLGTWVRRSLVASVAMVLVAFVWYAASREPNLALGAAPTLPDDVRPQYAAAAADSQARLVRLRTDKSFPGVGSAVALAGDVAWVDAFGYSDLETKTHLTADSQFPIGSVSKTLTAAIAMRLKERGVLDLDADVRKYAPAFPAKAHVVTPRQLLSHQAGIRHYGFLLSPPAFSEMTLNRQFASVEESLAVFANDDLLFEPDTQFQYSTFGYTLLSAALEGAAGKPFLELVRDEIVVPLGLLGTEADDSRRKHPNRTTDYVASPEPGILLRSPQANSSNKWAGGGLLSTPRDLVTFGAALLNGRLLPSSLADEMFTPRKLKDGNINAQRYGLGWRIGGMKVGDDTIRLFHHGGTAIGSQCVLFLVPDHSLVVAVCGNAYLGGSGTVLQAAADVARIFLRAVQTSTTLPAAPPTD